MLLYEMRSFSLNVEARCILPKIVPSGRAKGQSPKKNTAGYFGHSWKQVTENGSETQTQTASEILMPSGDDGVGVDGACDSGR